MLAKRIILLLWICLIAEVLVAQDLYRIQEAGRFGYIDETGKKVIPCIYVNAGEFKEGLAPVRLPKGLFGYINTKEKWAIKPQYDYAREFSEGLAVVYEDGNAKVIDKKQRLKFDKINHNQVIKIIEIEDYKNKFFVIACVKKMREYKQFAYIKVNREGNSISDFFYEYKNESKISTKRKLHYVSPFYKNDKDSVIYTFKNEYEVEDSIDTTIKLLGNEWLNGKLVNFSSLPLNIPNIKDSVYLYVPTSFEKENSRPSRYNVYLINTKYDTLALKTGIIPHIQALNKQGKWVNITESTLVRCGMEAPYHYYKKNEIFQFNIPIFKGNFKTKCRLMLSFQNQVIYSNEYESYLNSAMLWKSNYHPKTAFNFYYNNY